MTDDSLEEILEFFESYRLDLNAYWDDPAAAQLIDGVLRGKARSLGYYLRKGGFTELAEELAALDLSQVGVVEYVEAIRGHIVPEARQDLRPAAPPVSRPNSAVIAAIEEQKQVMIAVATGGPRINDVNDEYIRRREVIGADLAERGLEDPNPFADLWKWYGKWSSEIPGYQPRREFIVDLYEGLLKHLRTTSEASRPSEPTGWARVDRSAHKIRLQVARAKDEEDFQAVGLLCRDVLISVAQEVFDLERYPSVDGVEPGATDAGRMLEAFFAVELPGSEHEAVRRHAKAALALANALTHKRTAEFRAAALCAEATLSVINIVAIVSGRRDRS